MKKHLAVGSAAVLTGMSGLLGPYASADETAPSALADLEKSIVLIETKWTGYVYVPASASADGNGYWTDQLTYSTTCTAFYVSTSAELISAGHCVDPAEGRRVILEGYINDQKAPDLLQQAITNWTVEGDENGKPVERTVLGYQPEHVAGATLNSRPTTLEVLDFKPFDSGDLSLLKVPDLSVSTPAMPIAKKAPEVGAALTSIGFPGIVRNISDQTQIARSSFKTGSTSSRQVSPHGVVEIEVNTDLQGGMSGGPTVNGNGEVVGVNSSGFNAAGNFNFVTYTPDLRTFLSSHSVAFVEPKAAKSADKGSGPVSAILIAVGAVLILALIGGGVFVLKRRRPKRGAGLGPQVGIPLPPSAPLMPPSGSATSDQITGSPTTVPGPSINRQSGMAGVATAARFCAQCGTHLEPDEHFCPQCGKKFG